MRNYQRTKNNPFLLPHNLYMRTLYIIKDYDRLKEEYHVILNQGLSSLDGQPRGNKLSDPTSDKAIKLVAISRELKAIEQSVLVVPDEYREGLLSNIKYGVLYPDKAHYNTWRNWKYRLIWNVARHLNFI